MGIFDKVRKTIGKVSELKETLSDPEKLKAASADLAKKGLESSVNKLSERSDFIKRIQESPSKSINPPQRLSQPEYPEWQISISFRESKSNNFDTALFLAKKSNSYLETVSDGKIIYQAYFDADSYSDFEILYKLIKDWKSTFVLLNGEIIDKKAMSKLNICLGDKVRYKDPSFCFGASEYTTNPFGCHRLMITPSQRPWWEYGFFNNRKEWVIDKQKLKEQILNKSSFYGKCPYFNLKNSLAVVDLLPDKLTERNDRNYFIFDNGRIYPKEFTYSKIDGYYLK